MYCHIAAFVIGLLLDFIIGDPHWMPHPVRMIGRLIGFLEGRLLGESSENGDLKKNPGYSRNVKAEIRNGIFMVIIVIVMTAFSSAFIILISYRVNICFGIVVEAVLTCFILAARSLSTESIRVQKALESGDLEGARVAVSMIVGRDTEALDESGVARAAVETVAENTSDGVIAPLIYTFIGGPVLGFIYKAINTMDSMVGYHNDRFEYFGRAAARLDDIVNYIPARISAIFMIVAAVVLGKDYSAKNAVRIFKRDRYNHKSPNSAQTESVCAGALGLRLAGDAFYFGKLVKKPFIGDANRNIEPEDISRSGRLMFTTEFITALACFMLAGTLQLIFHIW